MSSLEYFVSVGMTEKASCAFMKPVSRMATMVPVPS